MCSRHSWREGWDKNICAVGMGNICVSVSGESLIYICVILPIQLHLNCIPKSSNETLERGRWSCGKVHSHHSSWVRYGSRFPVQPRPVILSYWVRILESWWYHNLSFGGADPVCTKPDPPPLSRSLCVVKRWGTETENFMLLRSWFFSLSGQIQKLFEFCVNSCF